MFCVLIKDACIHFNIFLNCNILIVLGHELIMTKLHRDVGSPTCHRPFNKNKITILPNFQVFLEHADPAILTC